jgi:ComF family protein
MAIGIQHLIDAIKTFSDDVIDFIYPPFCGICEQRLRRHEKNICQTCWRSLTVIEEPFCRRCGLALVSCATLCSGCRSRQRSFSFARSFGLFDENLQRIIHLFKYRRRRSLADPLAELLATMIRRDRRFQAMEVILPVPLHPLRARQRGYNQSRLMASHLARRIGLQLMANVLVRVKNTASQSNLGLAARRMNVHNAFGVRHAEAIRGRRLMLVDDVYTTGATVEACAQVLLEAGAKEVSVVTVARTPEPEDPESGRVDPGDGQR